MATGQGGYYTNGLTIQLGIQLGTTWLVAVDTQNPKGSSPQTVAVELGLISQANNNYDTLTAKAGGGKAGATQLRRGFNRVSVCASGADSCLLPFATPGAWVVLINDGAQSTTVFGAGTDTIDGVASATGNAMAAAKRTYFYAMSGDGIGTAGTWYSNAGAKIT